MAVHTIKASSHGVHELKVSILPGTKILASTHGVHDLKISIIPQEGGTPSA